MFAHHGARVVCIRTLDVAGLGKAGESWPTRQTGKADGAVVANGKATPQPTKSYFTYGTRITSMRRP